MFSHPDFNSHYEDLLKQLPPFMKKDEQVRGIHSNIEELLTRKVNRYFRKRDCQKIKIETNTASDGSKEREALLKQKENNIKKTIENQVAEEYKRLKDDYDDYKLEDQQKSSSDNLKKQYKSCISTLEKSIVIKDKEIGKLFASIS
ncbi:15578_t:CDS:2 [Funneliformis geosporum]|nr:15578_t:CDS:2 [Funneliformis geosporum]